LTLHFDITGTTESDTALRLPPKWTYGTPSSFKEAFCSLPPLAPERASFVECVAQWLKGLVEQAEKNPQQSLFLNFQSARIASSFAQYNEQPILKELEDLKRRVERWCWARWGNGHWNWQDRSMSNKSVDDEDYRDYYLENGMLADDYIVKWGK